MKPSKYFLCYLFILFIPFTKALSFSQELIADPDVLQMIDNSENEDIQKKHCNIKKLKRLLADAFKDKSIHLLANKLLKLSDKKLINAKMELAFDKSHSYKKNNFFNYLHFLKLKEIKKYNELISHFVEQAQKLQSKIQVVVSDIDDTAQIFMDQRYKHEDKDHQKRQNKLAPLYPGYYAFVEAIISSNQDKNFSAGLILNTARPSFLLSEIPKRFYAPKKDRHLGLMFLPGSWWKSLLGGRQWGISNKYMAQKKASRMKELLEFFPELEIIFLGDSAQGDLLAAKKMKKLIKHTYIHDIGIYSNIAKETKEQLISSLNEKNPPLSFFNNYATAIIMAYEAGHIRGFDLFKSALDKTIQELTHYHQNNIFPPSQLQSIKDSIFTKCLELDDAFHEEINYCQKLIISKAG